MKLDQFRKYLLSSVYRSPDDPAAATPAVVEPAPAAAEPAAPVAAEAPAAAEPAAADAKPQSTPSLLEAATAEKPGAKAEDAKPDASKETPAAAAAEPGEAAEAAKPGDKPATEDGKDKPADAKPAEPAKPDAAPAPQPPVPEPQARNYEAFTVPEGIALREQETKAFTGILDDNALSPQERGQKLVDLYVSEAQRIASDIARNQREVWDQYQEGQIRALKDDPDYGGNRQDTALGRAKAMIEMFGGDEPQVAELLRQMTYTGMGNSLPMTRLLNNMWDMFGEAAPVPATPPGPGKRSWKDKAYGAPSK